MNLYTPGESEFDRYHSHTGKYLRTHMEGVLRGVRFRSAPFSTARVVEVAALFHDLGKLGPNFQPKVQPEFIVEGDSFDRNYSRHAYLSAYVFLCYCATNDWKGALGLDWPGFRQVLALVAHHHGHLPNFEDMLANDECKSVLAFLTTRPPLPVSDFLGQWLSHTPFDVLSTQHYHLFQEPKFRYFPRAQRDRVISHRLDYFLETQFAFASLIESDKRDAGDNILFRRQEQLVWAGAHFEPRLQGRFIELSESEKANDPLNLVRTQMREEAEKNLKAALPGGRRAFAVTAATGAGKTYMLLALANIIRSHASDHSVTYGLPFLTITEQVEGICRDVFGQEFVSRFDSRTQDPELDRLQAKLDKAPIEQQSEKWRELLAVAFSDESFDAAFTVTTFVQIFETLLSNRNATLLKLPNFSKTIFLLDEIQALPMRLYVFFIAFLEAFCEKFDSYVIFSTATMPCFKIAKEAGPAQKLFAGYKPPIELLPKTHSQNPVFNRYKVQALSAEKITPEELTDHILAAEQSCLVVLNTIADSKCIYDQLKKRTKTKVILLNTHFTLRDRQRKVRLCKSMLEAGNRVILVSTQLIEAGVDIDFPVVYRDLCPLPSVIQAAGRCNRNGKLKHGVMWFFELIVEGKSRASLIYGKEPDWLLGFSREQILQRGSLSECDLFPVQEEYFDLVGENVEFGSCRLYLEEMSDRVEANLVEQIDALAFANVGSFQLIEEDNYGESYQYFVPRRYDLENDRFEQLQRAVQHLTEAIREADGRLPFDISKKYQMDIQAKIRCLSKDMVQFRVRRGQAAPAFHEECNGIRRLAHDFDYSREEGIIFDGATMAFL